MRQVSVILPVHEEAESIEAVVREIYEELRHQVGVHFVVCEDGSRDGTKDVLRTLSQEIPMSLEMSDERKGYSQAVLDGLHMVDTPYFVCLDSDGQCDPKDFWSLWRLIDTTDIVIGRRVPRRDAWQRRALSKGFYLVFKSLFRVKVHDPSCPFVVGHRRVIQSLPDKPALDEGFWWEFVARMSGQGYRIEEVRIRHRARAMGRTKVYTWRTIPRIARTHVAGLWRIKRELR